MELPEATTQLHSMRYGSAISALQLAARDVVLAEVEQLRGGPPGPFPTCSDCGRAMVWAQQVTVDRDGKSWICPWCVYSRMRRAEPDSERLDWIMEHTATTPDSREEIDRMIRDYKALGGEH